MTDAATKTSHAARAYRAAALLTLNTVLLLVVLNLAAWAVLALFGERHRVSPAYDGLMEHGLATLAPLYPGTDETGITELLRESWTLPLVYEPYLQFRESPTRGRYVNVDAHGFRWNGPRRPPWPPARGVRTVFVFGGSTVFGYGLPDDATLPAELGRRLGAGAAGGAGSVAVYNFGRAYYNSTQERLLFEQLLARGRRPDAAVFVNGLNDALLWPSLRGAPHHTRALRRFVERQRLSVGWGIDAPDPSGLGDAMAGLPLVRLARAAGRRIGVGGDGERRRPAPLPAARVEPEMKEMAATHAANRELARAAAAAPGVEVVHVLQPVPWVGYDLSRHLFRPPPAESAELERRFDAAYRALIEASAGGLVDCSRIFAGTTAPAYLDRHHYTARAIAELAECVAAPLDERLGSGVAVTAAVAEGPR